MSTKLVRYKDVCNAVIPMIADMLQHGNIEPAIDTLKALGALENVEDVDLAKDADPAKAVKEYCKTQHQVDCLACKYHGIGGYGGCFFVFTETAPEAWTI